MQVFIIIVLIMSAVFHEYMHGWMADRLGDKTPGLMGRLTLNPIAHIDLFGSILLPALLVVTGAGFVIGWAKPVPFNPHNLSDQKFGSAKVAVAGPLANLTIALVFGLILRFFALQLVMINPALIELFEIIIFINLLLMVFNLVPIPPLDGSKVIDPFLPPTWREKYLSIEHYGMFLVLIFVFFAFPIILPVINFLFSLIIGG